MKNWSACICKSVQKCRAGHFTHNHPVQHSFTSCTTGKQLRNAELCVNPVPIQRCIWGVEHTSKLTPPARTSSYEPPPALKTLNSHKAEFILPDFLRFPGLLFPEVHIPSFISYIPFFISFLTWALINTGGISTAFCSISGYPRLITLPGPKKARTKPLIC